MSYISAITQNVISDPNNSSTADIVKNATYEGTGSSTLSVAGIQVTFKADQNCTIYVEQSSDNSNWDISDVYNYKYTQNGFGTTVQAVSNYYRVRVTNVGYADTTYVRLATALCPIVEALPRSLDSYGNLKTSVQFLTSDEYGSHAHITPNNALQVATHTKLVGTAFQGATLDPSFWTATVTGTGAVTQGNARVVLATGATADSTARLTSVRNASLVGNTLNVLRMGLQLPTITGAVEREWGVMAGTTDGFLFGRTDATFYVKRVKTSSGSATSNTDFNGELGQYWTPDTNYHTWEIAWNSTDAWFLMDGETVHHYTTTTATLTDTATLGIYAKIANTSGNTNANTLNVRNASISRVGQLSNERAWKNIISATTTICKYGHGRLIRVINNAHVGSATIYDNTAASGTTIASPNFVSSNTRTPSSNLEYDIPFFNGLTIVSNGSVDITVVYE